MPDFLSPGAAASNSLSEFLLQRKAEAQQDFLNKLRLEQEDRLRLADQLDFQDRMAAVKERANAREVSDISKATASLLPGDIPDPSLVAKAQKHPETAVLFKTTPPTVQGEVSTQPIGPLETMGTGPAPTVKPPSAVYLGTAAQRTTEAQKKLRESLAAGVRAGRDPKDLIGDYLAGGGDPKEAEGIITAIRGPKPPAAATPGVGTFGEYLTTIAPDGDPKKLSSAQILDERKKWMDMGRAPQGPIAIYSIGPDGKPIPQGSIPHGGRIANPPGAAQTAIANVNKQTGISAVNRLDSDIEEAAQMGLIGPAAGRFYDALAQIGTTGDPAKDAVIGRLKGDILLAKMHVDAGIGGTRAAASPLLLRNWEDIAISSSPDLLKGYTKSIRDDMTAGLSTGGNQPPKSKYKVTVE